MSIENTCMSSKLIALPDLNPMNKVIGFSGSPRKNGNSDILLKNILSGANQEKVHSDYFNLT
ncbi:MAG: hypothetical protein ACR2PB_08415, partial [Desulfocapsaceae bacterium]